MTDAERLARALESVPAGVPIGDGPACVVGGGVVTVNPPPDPAKQIAEGAAGPQTDPSPLSIDERLAPLREEIAALREIADALEPFDTDTQQRMLRWVCARFAPKADQ